MTAMYDWDSGLKDAKVSGKLPWFQPGFDGDVEVVETSLIATREKGPMWIVVVDVLHSNHPAHPVGQKFSWSQKLLINAGPGAVLEFACAALGGNPRNPADVEGLKPKLGDVMRMAEKNPTNNPFIGRKVHLFTVQTSKKDGGNFTKHMWSEPTGKAGAAYITPVAAPAPVPVPVPTAPAPSAWTPPWQKA